MRNKLIRGSLTVEASLVFPVFIFAALSIIYIGQLLLYEDEVQWALLRTGREVSIEYAASGKSAVTNPLYLATKMKCYLQDEIPVSMLRSRFDEETKEIVLTADYSIYLPFPIVDHFPFHFTEKFHTRAFSGVKTRAEDGSQEGDITVYVTETGKVFHKTLDCSYLKLSISQVKYGDLKHLRGEDGGIYYACESCGRGVFQKEQDVYVCNFGNRFHSSRGCTKLRRNIRQIRQSEAGGRLPCSKCATSD